MARRSPIQDAVNAINAHWPWVVGGAIGVGVLAYGARRLLGGPGLVTIIPIENHGLSQTINNPQLPYLNQLASAYGVCTNYSTRVHPSLPNYLLMTSGQDFGIRDDSYHLIDSGGADVFAQMTAAGVPWRSYAESMGTPCRTSDTSVFASRHVPALYYDDVVNGGACAQQVVDLAQLPADLAADAVRFAFVTPNLQNDWHDGTAPQLDAFLSQWIPVIMSAPGYQRNGIVIVVADENDSGNLVPCIVISENLRQRPIIDQAPYDHRSLCAGVQDWLGLGRLPATQDVNSIASMTR